MLHIEKLKNGTKLPKSTVAANWYAGSRLWCLIETVFRWWEAPWRLGRYIELVCLWDPGL